MKDADINTNQDFEFDDQVWYFLEEFTFNEFLLDRAQRDELSGGLLYTAVKKAGILPEVLENIEMTLIGFAKAARVNLEQDGLELPGRIRLFCQKKIFDEVNSRSADPQFFQCEQVMEYPQMIFDPRTESDGGWGFFLIERGAGLPDSCPVGSQNIIDLYLYKEGK